MFTKIILCQDDNIVCIDNYKVGKLAQLTLGVGKSSHYIS